MPGGFLQVFLPLEEGGYDENVSVRVPLPAGGHWQKVVVELPENFVGGRLRVDPLDCDGLIDLAGMQVVSRVMPDDPIWTCRSRARLEALRVEGTAELLPSARYLRIISHGRDPRLLLPEITVRATGEPLQLEIWMRYHTDWSSLAGSLREWVDAFRFLSVERATLAELEEKHETLESERAATQERAEVAESRASDAEREIEQLRQEKAAAEEEINRARVAQESLEAEIQRLHAVGVEANRQLEDARAAHARLEAERGAAQEHAERAMERLRQEVAAAEARIDEVRVAHQSLEEEIRRLQSSHGEEMERLQATAADAVARFNDAATALARLEAAENDQRSLRKERLLLATELNCLRDEFDAVRSQTEAELLSLRQGLAEKNQELQQVREQLGRLDEHYSTELGRRRSMQRSVSWKTTMPLRALTRLMTTGSLDPKRGASPGKNGQSA